MKRIPFLLLVVAACHSDATLGRSEQNLLIKAIPNPDLDILFVVDNSPSMEDEQAALAAAFPLMMDRLAELDGGTPNLHIGVVTSDMGASAENGIAASLGTCSGVGDDGALKLDGLTTTDGAPYLVDVAGANGREHNYEGALRDAFSSIAIVGAAGCGFEQHLAAMSRAFDNPTNAGFFRPEANLAVVIIADEDDCSLRDFALLGPASEALGSQQSFRCFRYGVTCDQDASLTGEKTNCVPTESGQYISSVSGFIDRLVALKGDERKVMVAAITGGDKPVEVELAIPPGSSSPPESALANICDASTSSGSGDGDGSNDGSGEDTGSDWPTRGHSEANASVRLNAFIDGFPGRSTWTSVCNGNLSGALDQIGETAKGLMGDPCLDTAQLADTDASQAGVQPSCDVEDISDAAPDANHALPDCSTGAADCFELAADPAICPESSDHMRVRVHRATAASDDTWTSVTCRRATH